MEVLIDHSADRLPDVPDVSASPRAWTAYQHALSRYAARRSQIAQAFLAGRDAVTEPTRMSSTDARPQRPPKR